MYALVKIYYSSNHHYKYTIIEYNNKFSNSFFFMVIKNIMEKKCLMVTVYHFHCNKSTQEPRIGVYIFSPFNRPNKSHHSTADCECIIFFYCLSNLEIIF